MEKHTFEALKKELLDKAREKGACSSGYNNAAEAQDQESLLNVIYNYAEWCLANQVISNEYLEKFDPEILLASGLANTGKENTGISNSGDSNSGDSNSGDSNSGDRNSGDSNSGDSNSGYRNSGYRNSGDRNSGDRNSGYSNSGNWNSGYRNSGDRNSGYRNSGYRNSGYSNSGYSNSGNWNSGDRNSGNWNSGDRNSGDSNSGYRNSGAFCTDPNPKIYLFDQPTEILVKDWEKSKVVSIMREYLDFTVWVSWDKMSDAEKAEYPKNEACEGYLKTIPLKDAWQNMWGNLSEEYKNEFLTLPNFDAVKFEEITGICL